MAATIIGTGDPKAVQKFSVLLAIDTARDAYFAKRFMGVGESSPTPIQMLTDLERSAGEKISFDLVLQLTEAPTEGDDLLEGNEEDLSFYTDAVFIDQSRHGVSAGGRMTRKRTVHDLRRIARARLSEYWSRLFDEAIFIYLSGARGANTEYIWKSTWTGRAGNTITVPDADHLIYGGDATVKTDLVAADKMTLAVVERTVAKAKTMGGGTQGTPRIQPIMIDGERTYCLVMHTWSAYDMRTATASTDWLEVQKAAAGAEGRNNPMFKGALGMYAGVVLHDHDAVVRFSDYGVGANVPAARNLFLGQQAGVMAFGDAGSGLRFNWHEEADDRGNVLIVDTDCKWGFKKTTFNSKDFGVIAIDVAAADPS